MATPPERAVPCRSRSRRGLLLHWRGYHGPARYRASIGGAFASNSATPGRRVRPLPSPSLGQILVLQTEALPYLICLGLNEAEVRDAVIKAIGRAQKAMTASPASLPGKAIG